MSIFETACVGEVQRSALHADGREPDAGLELPNCKILTWASWLLNWDTQAPQSIF